jgi:hypothetical protein
MKASKYVDNWQFFRSALKGRSWDEKRAMINFYANKYFSIDYKDRILNYIHGCLIASRDKQEKYEMALLEKELKNTQAHRILKSKEYSRFNFSISAAKNLFKDLYIRNKKWLRKGYFHSSQNMYLDGLLYNIEDREGLSSFVQKYRKALEEDRLICSHTENRHKFLY